MPCALTAKFQLKHMVQFVKIKRKLKYLETGVFSFQNSLKTKSNFLGISFLSKQYCKNLDLSINPSSVLDTC